MRKIMKIGIICLNEGDPEKAIPIMNTDENDESTGSMATFGSWKSARKFADSHILCKVSICYFIDLEKMEISI